MPRIRTAKSSGETTEIRAETKRAQIPVRTTPATKDRLIDAAAANDRSLTQEIEQRLEWSLSFERDLGGPARIALFRQMAWAMYVIEGQHGGKLESDYWAFHRARGAIEGTLEAIRPPVPAEWAGLLDKAQAGVEAALAAHASTAEALAKVFPYKAPRNALLPGSDWVVVPEPRFNERVSDEQLEALVADLPADVAELVRAHQDAIRRYENSSAALRTARKILDNEAQKAAAGAKRQTLGYAAAWSENAELINSLMEG